jgi:hypothetical protein
MLKDAKFAELRYAARLISSRKKQLEKVLKQAKQIQRPQILKKNHGMKAAPGKFENGGRTAGGKAGVLRRDRSIDQRLALRRFLDFLIKALREATLL